MSNQKPVLTISLLISNRPDTIPRCLDSLKPIMEAIPSELILIDTSKSEEIRHLLLNYTDQVYPFEWCQDFAKARNEGLKRAKGEWYLYLDDDEWFVEYDELISFFQSGEYKDYGYANFTVRNFADAEFKEYNDSWVTRLFQIDKDTLFVGKVHEIFQPAIGKQKFLDVIANHTGYIFETKESVQKHFERNSAILLKVIEEDPFEVRWQAQMVQEYNSVNDWVHMAEACEEYLKRKPKIETFMQRNHLSTIYAGLAYSLLKLGRNEESISACNRAFKDKDVIELLVALMNFYLAENYVALENWKAVKKYTTRYLQLYQELTKNKVLMREQAGSLLVKDTFRPNHLKKAYSMLACYELKNGNVQGFSDYYEKLEWDAENVWVYEKLGEVLIEMMTKHDYVSIFGHAITDACKNERFRSFVCGQAQKWEEKDDQAFGKLAYAYAQAESGFWFIWYCRMVVADLHQDKEGVVKALRGFLYSIGNAFHLPKRVHTTIEKYDIPIALLWEEVLGDKWEIHLESYISNQKERSENDFETIRTYLKRVYDEESWQVLSLETKLLERQISAGPTVQVYQYYELLKNYASKKLLVYMNLHKENVSEELPEEIKAAIKIKEYIELESQDKVQALGRLKDAVEVNPQFSSGIGKFVHLYAEFEKQRAKCQKEEMMKLRNEVMQQVRTMQAAGQKDAALQIIGQLKQMFPNDLEVATLALEVRING